MISVQPEVLDKIMEQISPDDRWTDLNMPMRNVWLYSWRMRPIVLIDREVEKKEHKKVIGFK